MICQMKNTNNDNYKLYISSKSNELDCSLLVGEVAAADGAPAAGVQELQAPREGGGTGEAHHAMLWAAGADLAQEAELLILGNDI